MATETKTYTVPYRSQLQEKFEPGQTLIVKGRAVHEALTENRRILGDIS